MSDLFLPPPFDAADTLAPHPRRRRPFRRRRPATLAGHGLRRDAERRRRRPRRRARRKPPRACSSAAAGEARARLDFAMAALGAAPAPVTVATGGGPAPAEAYLFAGAAPDGQGVPAGEDRARLAEALVEVMGHYGRRPAADMPSLLHGIGIRALGRARGPHRRLPVVLGTAHAAGDVESVERDFAYAHYFGVEEHRLRHRRFDGTMSEVIGRGVFTSGDAVTVLPYDPRRDTVLMIEQFRAGPFARRDPRPWSLEPPPAAADRAEPPEETARREAREEAGLDIGRVERIAAFYPSPGIMSEYITAFVGEADLGRGRRRLRPRRGARGHPRHRRAPRRRARGLRLGRDRHRAAAAVALLARPPRRAAPARMAVIRPPSGRRLAGRRRSR